MRATKIKLTVKTTNERFGCSKEYFDRFIKGKVLDVVSDHKYFVKVVDANGEHWHVHNEILRVVDLE